MNKKWFLFTIFICCLVSYCAGEAITVEDEKNDKEPSAIDKVARTVLFLEFEEPVYEIKEGRAAEVWYKYLDNGEMEQKKSNRFGTGFLVRHNQLPYVVTAKHVVKNKNCYGTYYFSSKRGKVYSNTFQKIQKEWGEAKWFFHEYADIAIHPIGFPTNLEALCSFMKEGMLESQLQELLSEVCIPGFPYTLGKDSTMLSPVVSQCRQISWPTEVPNEQRKDPRLKFILLDKRLGNGYSGALVLSLGHSPAQSILKGHDMKLIGVVCESGTIEAKGGRDEMTLVLPTSYLLDIFEYPEVKTYEAARLATINVEGEEQDTESERKESQE